MKQCTIILVVAMLLVTACDAAPPATSGTAVPPPIPTVAPTQASAPVGTLPAGAQAAVALYAESVGVSPDTMQVVSYEAVEFPDGCLGAASAGEMCTAAITPGYRIVLESNGVQTTIHSDLEGTYFRIP